MQQYQYYANQNLNGARFLREAEYREGELKQIIFTSRTILLHVVNFPSNNLIVSKIKNGFLEETMRTINETWSFFLVGAFCTTNFCHPVIVRIQKSNQDGMLDLTILYGVGEQLKELIVHCPQFEGLPAQHIAEALKDILAPRLKMALFVYEPTNSTYNAETKETLWSICKDGVGWIIFQGNQWSGGAEQSFIEDSPPLTFLTSSSEESILQTSPQQTYQPTEETEPKMKTPIVTTAKFKELENVLGIVVKMILDGKYVTTITGDVDVPKTIFDEQNNPFNFFTKGIEGSFTIAALHSNTSIPVIDIVLTTVPSVKDEARKEVYVFVATVRQDTSEMAFQRINLNAFIDRDKENKYFSVVSLLSRGNRWFAIEDVVVNSEVKRFCHYKDGSDNVHQTEVLKQGELPLFGAVAKQSYISSGLKYPNNPKVEFKIGENNIDPGTLGGFGKNYRHEFTFNHQYSSPQSPRVKPSLYNRNPHQPYLYLYVTTPDGYSGFLSRLQNSTCSHAALYVLTQDRSAAVEITSHPSFESIGFLVKTLFGPETKYEQVFVNTNLY